MTTGQLCQACRAAVLDRYLCRACEQRLADRAHDVAPLLDELDTTLARLGRSPGAGSASDPAPVIDEGVSVVAATLRGCVLGWVAVARVETPPVIDPVLAAAWLWSNAEPLATGFPQAGAMLTDLDRRSAAAWRKVDRPEARWYAGVCGAEVIDPAGSVWECARVLWAGLDDTLIQCPTCRTRWTVAERRDHLLRVAGDHIGPVREVASIATLVTRTRVTRQRIGMWITRGRLIPEPRLDEQTPARVRVRDVLALLDQPEPTDHDEVPA